MKFPSVNTLILGGGGGIPVHSHARTSIVPTRTMTSHCDRHLLLPLLLITIIKVNCDGHDSLNFHPRGPDLDKPATGTSTSTRSPNSPRDHGHAQTDEEGQEFGECPAEDEQVYTHV